MTGWKNRTLNRTIQELKQGTGRSYNRDATALNRTIQELKPNFPFVSIKVSNFKSNHSGIETRLTQYVRLQ